MAEDNLKDFAVNWMVIGLLLFCLIAFTLSFMYDNNPIGLNDGSSIILNTTNSNLNTRLYAVESEADELLNITANTNPEVSDLGSRDSVATAYKTYGTSKGMWESTKILIAWVFVGETGKILLGVFTGLIGFLGVYFITKWIRTGS